MPATSYVRVHRKSLYYARPERATLYDSTEEDVRSVWDGSSQEGDESGGKDAAEDELLLAERPQPLVERPATGRAELSRQLMADVATVNLWASVLELVGRVEARRTEHIRQGIGLTADGLCCPICEGVLRYPVTATCGHTFCRQCCFGHGRCTVCGQRFPSVAGAAAASSSAPVAFTSTPSASVSSASGSSSSSSATVTSGSFRALPAPEEGSELAPAASVGFELDILIRRLVERWWAPELKAADLHEEAQRHLEDNSLDEALRCCNQSLEHVDLLEKGPFSYIAISNTPVPDLMDKDD
uniref:RING-type domain-containing protein n=1 Tax=Anopheles merus TaxID=30066 RepID=A0A182VG55_ANOME